MLSIVRFEQILLDQEPLPSYGLKLLLTLLDQNGGFVKQFEQQGLVSVIFQVMMVSFTQINQYYSTKYELDSGSKNIISGLHFVNLILERFF